MCRCSKFEVYGCQHVCMESMITASKYKEKIQSRFENINKIKTEFPQSEIQWKAILMTTAVLDSLTEFY